MAILTLTCPACQKLFSFTTHPAFDTGKDPSIAEKVRTGEAFVGACPHCGHTEHYSYSFLCKERESHALLYYADNEDDFRKACAIMTGRDPSVPWAGIADWSRRVVANRQVLLEKLLLLDLHLDDRVIEIMKVLGAFLPAEAEAGSIGRCHLVRARRGWPHGLLSVSGWQGRLRVCVRCCDV